ncbi:hypothetical protein ACFQZ2_10205, partial [Streptomonospora algeriensis]
MDIRRRGRALAPESFPDPVRRRLGNLDRLREVWTERRRYGDRSEDPAVNRRSARRRVEALRHLAGVDASDATGGAAEEDAFLAIAEDCRSGVRLTPEYFEELVHGAPDFSPPLPAPSGVGELLAEAAAVETHPVIRAAHLFATCTEALESGSAQAAGHDPATGGPPPHLRPLPWWLAGLSLLRSDLPPPAIDLNCPPPPPGRASTGIPDAPAAEFPRREAAPETPVPAPRAGEDRLTPLVLLLADLETA